MSQTDSEATEAQFALGLAAYREGRASDAESHFLQVLNENRGHGRSWFYLGLLAVAVEAWPDARDRLTLAVEHEPSLSAGWHYLGQAFEMLSEQAEAVRCYEESVRLDPKAEGSRNALRRMQLADTNARFRQQEDEARSSMDGVDGSSTKTAQATAPLATSGESLYGVYEVLETSTDPLLRQPLPMMDELRMDKRPRLSAFWYRYLTSVVAGLLVGYVLAQALALESYIDGSSGPTAEWGDIFVWGAAATFAILSWQVALAGTTRYSIDKGRLQVQSGILVRRRSNLELYRAADILLTQNFIQRLTGDGTLIFETADLKRTRVVGLAQSQELTLVWQRLLNLVFALRSNNYVRGIIS